MQSIYLSIHTGKLLSLLLNYTSSIDIREWTEDGQLWIQYVSSTPATRLDVINLQEQLDHQLQARQARETGICPIREELYSQCFGACCCYYLCKNNDLTVADIFHVNCTKPVDELIRQITINCAERGLLLLRVRDEARMTITAYETLYESSIAYGVRKALVAEQKRIDLDARLRELAQSKRELQQQVENLKHTIESTQARSIQKRDAEERVHSEDVSFLQLFFPIYVTLI